MKNIEKFLNELKTYFNERLSSVFIYGSKADTEFNRLDNDINIIVIVKDLNAMDLKGISKASKNWAKKGNPLPIFLDKDEWFTSSDVYAIEYSDIIDSHNIIYGEDVISHIKVNKKDLRFQCELEVKNFIINFRQLYLEYADKKDVIKSALTKISKTCITIFRAVLRLNKIPIPQEKEAVISIACEKAGINTELFIKLLCHKEGKCKIKSSEIEELSDELINSMTKLLMYVNNM